MPGQGPAWPEPRKQGGGVLGEVRGERGPSREGLGVQLWERLQQIRFTLHGVLLAAVLEEMGWGSRAESQTASSLIPGSRGGTGWQPERAGEVVKKFGRSGQQHLLMDGMGWERKSIRR